MKSNAYRLLAISAIILSTVITGFSDPTFWIGGIGSVNDAGNWSSGLPDNSGTNLGVVSTGTVTGGGDDFSAKGIQVSGTGGVEITSDLTLTDGDISLTANTGLIANGDIDITLGSGAGIEGYISVSGTSLFIMTLGDLTIGGDSNGTFSQSGGTVEIANGLLTLGKNSNAPGKGEYWLSGGTLQVNDITYASINSWVDLSSTGTGVLEVSTNNYSIASAEANISNGNIRRDSVIADVSLFSITEDGGYIKVQAIPEPATLGLMSLVAGGIYFKRRFFPAV